MAAVATLSGALMVASATSRSMVSSIIDSIRSVGLGSARVCTGIVVKSCKDVDSDPRTFNHPYVMQFTVFLAMAMLLFWAPSKGREFFSMMSLAVCEIIALFLFTASVATGSTLAVPVCASATLVVASYYSLLSGIISMLVDVMNFFAGVGVKEEARRPDERRNPRAISFVTIFDSKGLVGAILISIGVAVPLVAKGVPSQPWLGILLAVGSGFFRGVRIGREEAFLVMPGITFADVVGTTGLWGVILMGAILAALQITPGHDFGSMLSSADPWKMICNSGSLQIALGASAVLGAMQAYCGAIVSSYYSSTARVATEALFPCALWAVSMYEGWITFDATTAVGFLLVVSGWALLTGVLDREETNESLRSRAHTFLQGRTEFGFLYEMTCVLIIVANIACFVMGTVEGLPARVYSAFDHFERVTMMIFTAEYVLRFWASAESAEMGMYSSKGIRSDLMTRVRWMLSFYSIVDLSSLLPYYIETYSLVITAAACGTVGAVDLPAFQFMRLFRLFRIIRLDGKYLEAFTVFDDIYKENKRLLFTSSFVGGAVWVILSGANWASERSHPAHNGRFDTVLSASYFTLCNLFGEFPEVNERTALGKVIAVITAGIAVAVFAIPTGIFGNGFQAHAEAKSREAKDVVSRREVESGQGLQWTVYAFVKGKSTAGRWYERGMLLLIVANVSSFIVGSTRWAEADKDVTAALDMLEFASIGVFSVDYVLRFYSIGLEEEYSGFKGRMSYITSFYSIVDLAAVLPFYLGILTPLANVNTSFIRALRLLRMLKAEAYVEAFTVFDDIIYNNRDVLTVTGFAAAVLWVFFSSVMYLLEKDNKALLSPRGDHYYRSIPASMWITLLNLTGEVPLCDYTPWGKVVSGIMGVVAVGSFAIPIGILGAGFEDWVSSRYQKDDKPEPPVSAKAAPLKGFTGHIYRFLEGRTALGAWYETLMFYLVFANVAEQALETVPSFFSQHSRALELLELASVVIFTVDYLLRFLTAHHDPDFAGKSMPNLRYIFSFYSIIDLLTTAPYFLALAFPGSVIDQYDEALRMLRLLRLLKMDKYIPSVTLIDDVFRNNAVPLLVTGFTATVFWVIFATMLWMAEDGDSVVTGDNGITQGQRFQDVPTALQYTLILLSGDYPLCDFVFWGQVTCFLMCLFAVSVVSIPSSIIASGFTDEALKKRARAGISSTQDETKAEPPNYLNDNSLSCQLHSLLSPDDDKGVWFDYMNIALIAANVLSVVLESDPAYRASIGSEAFDSLELITTVIYTMEYAMRLAAASHDKRAGYSVKGYLLSFFGTADFVALLPWYLDVGMRRRGTPVDFAMLRVLRLVRILQLEHFTEAFTLIDDVFRQCKDTLVATSFLAVIIWVGAAYAFFLTEKGNPAVGGAFDNIPNSMYYTAIFLSGEWGQVDFTLPGKVFCCILVVAGIGLYSIPVGALFDAFGEVLAEQKEKDKKKKD